MACNMRCKHCGFETQETFDRCPACGKLQSDPVEPETPPVREEPGIPEQAAEPPLNRSSIVGFSLGCAGFLISVFGLKSLAGLILSIVGLSELRFTKERGKGFAVAGIVVSCLSLIRCAFTFVYMILLVHSGAMDQLLPFIKV